MPSLFLDDRESRDPFTTLVWGGDSTVAPSRLYEYTFTNGRSCRGLGGGAHADQCVLRSCCASPECRKYGSNNLGIDGLKDCHGRPVMPTSLIAS